MSQVYVSNAFSIQMIACPRTVVFADATKFEVAAEIAAGQSIRYAVGHEDTAALVARELGSGCGISPVSAEEVFHRVSIRLDPGDRLYVFQIEGGRLPQGCTTLPEGVRAVWKKVTVER